MEGLARKPEKAIEELTFVDVRGRVVRLNEDELRMLRFFDPELREILRKEIKKEDKRFNYESEKIMAETKELSQKPESGPQVVQTAEFVTKITGELQGQKARLPDKKGKCGDQSGLLKDVCCDVKKYIRQINRHVQEKICSLPKEVRKKFESVMKSFQRLIARMWKLMFYDLLLYEMTSILATYQMEESNISKKRGRFKYGFQMASMMTLWLAHDVESNPGPSFCIRHCLERITRDLSEILRYHLPVDGSLWSKSVAAAAYAAGYSTDCQWSNPSGIKKDKLMPLIERATELGRVLTSLDCLPTELAPFVNDLGNYLIQEQLVIHYKVKNLSTAVDICLDISSLGDEQKQAIMHEIQRLEQISDVPHSSERPMGSGHFCNSTDFERLADPSTLHPTVSCKKKTVRRKHKRDRPMKEKGNSLEILNTSKHSAVPEPEDEVPLPDDIWIDPNIMDDDGIAQLQITEVATISPTGSNPTGQGQEVKQRNNLNNQLTRNLETPNNVLGINPPVLSEVVPFPPESDQAFQTHVDHATEQEETEWKNYACPQIYDDQIMRLQNLLPGQSPLNPDITERDKGSDSTIQENTGEGGIVTYPERDSDNLTQDKAEEHMTEDDDSIEHFVQGEQIPKTVSETEFLQHTISHEATGSTSCHEAVRDKVTSEDGGHRKGAQDDTCDNEAEKLSSEKEQLTAAETETEPIQQTVSPLTAVTHSYPDTDRDHMYREETVDDNTSVTRDNEAEDLTLGTIQSASREPADTKKQRTESTDFEHLAKLKTLFAEEFDAHFDARFNARFDACFDARLEAIMAVPGNNTQKEHVVQNENREPLNGASTDAEPTEPGVRSSDSPRRRNLTDPKSGPTPKKLKQ